MTNTVLITGSSSGFGETAARLFAARGWNVVATMRNPEAGGALAAADNILVTRLDVEDPLSIGGAIAAGIERFGKIDVIVNNAGYGLFSVFEPVSREAIQKQFDVNVFGAMDVIRAILPHFRANGAGAIINVSSGAGVFGAPMASIYSASKFALEGFSEALSYELASVGIKVKIIEPGGAPATGFMARTATEADHTSVPPDYNNFLGHIAGVYGAMATSADPDAVEKVVEAIFAAATDGTDQLRYQPTDDITAFVAARRETSEQNYIAMTRSLFLPPPATPESTTP